MKVSHAPHACSLGSNDEHVQQTEGGEEAHVISFCSNTEEIWSVTSSVPTTGGHWLDAEFHSAASRPGAPTLNVQDNRISIFKRLVERIYKAGS